jgi:hypothetical protein
MLAATALFTIMSALVKAASEIIPFMEVMFFRSALAMPVVLLIALRGRARWAEGVALLRTKRFPGHFLRACTGTAAMGCSFYALTSCRWPSRPRSPTRRRCSSRCFRSRCSASRSACTGGRRCWWASSASW